MQNKFTLTQAQNRFLAKKNIVALIHSISRLENVNTTFPQTQTIVGGALNNFSFTETNYVGFQAAWNLFINKKPF